VREPAIVSFHDISTPAPPSYERHEPAPEPASEDSGGSSEGQIAPERPRRSGWWQRR
jgi:hypothetical protein